MTKVKICGITRLKDALAAVDLGAWALGFIFYKKSPRYIAPSKAKKIIEQLPGSVTPVGVFVDENKTNVLRTAKLSGIKALQFHGDESPRFCQGFKKYKTVKAFRVKDKDEVKDVSKYKVNALLFDTFDKKHYGGSGRTFDWSLIKSYKKAKIPIILSGGLNAKNVKTAIKKISPYAVDISSGVETSPGKKSEKLLKELFKKIKR